MIEVENLVKRYGGHLAVDHLSFTVEKGQRLRLPGPKRRREIHHHEHDDRLSGPHRRGGPW